MNYELIKVSFVGSPKDTADPAIAKFFINVTTGIVGDKYGFTKTDTTNFDFSKTKTGEQVEELAEETAKQFIEETYPNTK